MYHAVQTVPQQGWNHAYEMFRRHFADFYGDLTQDELARLLKAERGAIRDVAERHELRNVARKWGSPAKPSASEESPFLVSVLH